MSNTSDEFHSTFFHLVPTGDVAVLRFQKKTLSDEDNVEQLGLDLHQLVDQLGYRRVVLSLAGVNWVTSSILGKFIHLHRHLNRNAGEMALCDVGAELDDVLTTSRLNTYFFVAPNLEAVLAHWNQET